MPTIWLRRAALLFVFVGPVPGCRGPGVPVVVVCVGDSITAGTVRAGVNDVEGGWPGRLGRLLGHRARVVNRGIGGATAGLWAGTAAPRATAIYLRLMERRWPELAGADDAPLLDRVLVHDRPDVVVVLLGVNDLRVDDSRDGERRLLGDLERLVRDARLVVPNVLVVTLPPVPGLSREAVARVNTGILELGAPVISVWAEMDGREGLFADGVHPTPEGHQALAEIVRDTLVARGIVDRP